MAEADPDKVTVDSLLDWAWMRAVVGAPNERFPGIRAGPPSVLPRPTVAPPADSGSVTESAPDTADEQGVDPPAQSMRGRDRATGSGYSTDQPGSIDDFGLSTKPTGPACDSGYTLVPTEVGPAGGIGSRVPGLRVPEWLGEAPAPAAFVLPDRLELARLLRRLREFGAAPNSVVLDEDATAEHAALTDLIVPILAPARERWFELALVVDSAASIDPWRRLLAEFARLLDGNGTFRAVRSWSLDTEVDGRAVLRTPIGTTSRSAAPVGVTGRRIIMVISDGVGRAWSDPGTAAMLATWAKQGPVVFVNLLPRRWWERSRVPLTPVVFRSQGTGPARRSAFRLRHGKRWTYSHERVAIPVIGVHPDGLRPGDAPDRRSGRWSELSRWTRMVTDERGREFANSAWVLDPRRRADLADPVSVPPEDARTPAARLAEFRAGASATAVELLGRLAAAPISLATVRVVQSSVLEVEDPAFAAEVFLSGLLVPSRDRVAEARADDVLYDLDAGVRETLLSGMSRQSALEVYFRVARFMDERLGRVEFDFHDLLTAREPLPVGLIGPHSRPLARVGAALLHQLGPDYRQIAKRLEARADGPMLWRRKDITHWWTRSMDQPVRARPISLDGLVVVLDTAGGLVVIDSMTGMSRHTAEVGERVPCAPVVTPGVLWVGGKSGRVHRFDPTTLTRRESLVPAGAGAVVAMAPVGTDAVLVATLDGAVTVLGDPHAGARARMSAAPGEPVGVCAGDGRLAVLERGGCVRAWRAGREHEECWITRLPGAVHGTPAADDERVYVPLALRGVTALRWDTGDVAWAAELAGGVLTAPQLAGGRVLAATADGFVYALDAATGEVVWRAADEPQPDLRVTVVGPLLHVAGAAGGIRTYDADTGRRLAEIRSTTGVSVAGGAYGQLILAGLDGKVTALHEPVVVD
ncbi:SAV_2336 N-terminal domain-related protein [Embleya scabrispora]|uniref:SAV_2336 N-terminal domain-related protein n=1 Tax=Embleya scabrispora TaxID=159449 RepID=UPI0003A58E62|nr:SAV_2336 N-terminal domain-related protein [Embleya scabrispora]MYS83782.1 PQQ-binding-like beta-propeller repeat protein [Streptomyces sp. SID5474]